MMMMRQTDVRVTAPDSSSDQCSASAAKHTAHGQKEVLLEVASSCHDEHIRAMSYNWFLQFGLSDGKVGDEVEARRRQRWRRHRRPVASKEEMQ